MQLARATTDSTAPDGSPLLGRGYEVRDDRGEPVPLGRLHPDRDFHGIAVADVESDLDHEQAMRNRAFGVGRVVRLRASRAAADRVAIVDESDELEAGWLPDDAARPALDLLERDPDLQAWVCWEWLADQGRTGLRVAVSRSDLAPTGRTPPPRPSAVQAALRSRTTWALVAVVVVALVIFASCI